MKNPKLPPPRIVYALHAKQYAAFVSKATEILFGGAAGGGKSALLRFAAIIWALSAPGLQVFLFRRQYADLRRNHMEGPQGFPVLLAKYIADGYVSIVEDEIRFWNGSKIYLCHCQHEKDLSKYLGVEIHVLLMDELTHFTESMYRFLRGRCRLGGFKVPPGGPVLPRIVCGSNPGSVGHHWVKATFVAHGTEPHQTPKQEGGMIRQFIPSRVDDNPSLLASDPDYLARLEGLGDPMLVRAMRDGDWDVVAGSMFGDTWRNERHLCAPFQIPDDWEMWRGADDGFAAPACCLWLAQNPATKTIYVIHEVYRTGMMPDYYAEATLKGDREIEVINLKGVARHSNRILQGLLDSAAFSNTGQNKVSRGEAMNALGTRWKPVEKGPGSRVQGIQNIHRLLAPNKLDPEGMPGLRIFDTCTNLVREITAIGRDKNNPEDVATEENDHSIDALRYALQWKRTAIGVRRVGGV